MTDDLELVFDTLASTRKAANLRRDARVAVVIGWDEAQTVQLEGVADEPAGAELARLQAAYFGAFADGPRPPAGVARHHYFRVARAGFATAISAAPSPQSTKSPSRRADAATTCRRPPSALAELEPDR